MRCRRVQLAGVFCALLASAGSASAQLEEPPQLQLVIAGDTVSVEQVTRGGNVVLFGVDRVVEADDFPSVFVTREIVRDKDEDGVVELTLDHAVPPRNVWIAVDLATGAEATSLPSETGQQVVEWRGAGLQRGQAEGEGDTIQDASAILEILVVRPGTGAWSDEVVDGGNLDQDGAPDGGFTVPIDVLSPVADTPAATESFAKDDLVYAVDPITMTLVIDRAP